MKYLSLSAAFVCFGLLAQGQPTELDIKATQTALAKINDSLFASKFEVTNDQYLNFLSFLKHNGQSDKYAIAKIDSAQWKDQLTYNEPYVKYYHTHAAYTQYPVVNISYEGATLFCEWMTQQYNSNGKRKYNKVAFRLPTKDEWITAAKADNSSATYPWEGNDLQTKKGLYRCNFKRDATDIEDNGGKLNDNADVTAPSKSYWPNDFGLYNMSGNVSEMLAEKGLAKGGSWFDGAESLKIDHEPSLFTAPRPSIGFRYFMEIVEK